MLNRSRVGEILVRAKVIDELQLRSAIARQDQWGGSIANSITEMGLADEDAIYVALAKALKVPQVHLGNINRDAPALSKIDLAFAEDHSLFPMALKDQAKTLVLAMSDPTDLETIDEVGRRSRTRVSVVLASETEIRHAILRHYRNIDPGTVAAARARQAVQKAASTTLPEDEEFKVTDMSGKTVMKSIQDITDPNAAAVALPPPVDSASDLLDQMLDAAPAPSFSAEELSRLEAVKLNQDKSARVVQALTQLLTEKGYLP